MKKILLFCFYLLFVSCKNECQEEKKCVPNTSKKLEMYQMSEMASLMEQMYVHNKQLREKIIKKDSLGEMPKYFLNISKAKMTKGKERDDFYITKADYFLKRQTEIYSSKNKEKSYNTMVNACISCHEVKCGGPIDRIKTLYIK